ncbi:hypothetical protein [Proteus hauseri]|uniref:hypothetical protein n=1 Tax=Proteus hauseri TaxID=183417 RepID=UPI0007E88BD8|nr:hypothetical protein [Proteus hauseri]
MATLYEIYKQENYLIDKHFESQKNKQLALVKEQQVLVNEQQGLVNEQLALVNKQLENEKAISSTSSYLVLGIESLIKDNFLIQEIKNGKIKTVKLDKNKIVSFLKCINERHKDELDSYKKEVGEKIKGKVVKISPLGKDF